MCTDNFVYLMLDEKKDCANFKVGFASDLSKRMSAYATHNPQAMCIDYVKTRQKSDKAVETMFHHEILKRGYTFIVSVGVWKKTEWFKVAYDDPFYEELKIKGLRAFNCGKNRKSYGRFLSTKSIKKLKESIDFEKIL